MVCDGLGCLEEWGIDLRRVTNRSEDIGAGARPDPDRYRLAVDAVNFDSLGFTQGCIENVEFSDCSFSDCDFGSSLLVNLSFTQCNLQDVSFAGASLRNVKFTDCQLQGSIWDDAEVSSVNAIGCDFTGASRSSAFVAESLLHSDDVQTGT